MSDATGNAPACPAVVPRFCDIKNRERRVTHEKLRLLRHRDTAAETDPERTFDRERSAEDRPSNRCAISHRCRIFPVIFVAYGHSYSTRYMVVFVVKGGTEP